MELVRFLCTVPTMESTLFGLLSHPELDLDFILVLWGTLMVPLGLLQSILWAFS